MSSYVVKELKLSRTIRDASVDAACATDPRRDWRGLAIAINGQTSAIDWYNLANWGPGEPNESTASSAYEWVTFDPSDPTTLVFFSQMKHMDSDSRHMIQLS